jgi:hypothetical protein
MKTRISVGAESTFQTGLDAEAIPVGGLIILYRMGIFVLHPKILSPGLETPGVPSVHHLNASPTHPRG